MLHAVNRRKARLDAFRGAGIQVPLEDVVTSAVFGPLLFLEQEEVEAATRLLLQSLGIPAPDWAGPIRLALWPQRKTVPWLRLRYVEPDAVIADAQGRSLLIEVKWRSGLDLHELAAQWLSLTPEEQSSSSHLLIVLERGQYERRIEEDRRLVRSSTSAPWPLHILTWRRMADAFRAMSSDLSLGPGTRHWASGVHGFIRREDPRSLSGWTGIGLVPVDAVTWRFSRRWFGDLDATTKSVCVFRWNWQQHSPPQGLEMTWSFKP